MFRMVEAVVSIPVQLVSCLTGLDSINKNNVFCLS